MEKSAEAEQWRAQHPDQEGGPLDIREINPITEGHTPIVEMNIEGVAVDLGFAQLQLATLQNLHSLEDDALLVGLDEKSARGVGGNRVNEMV